MIIPADSTLLVTKCWGYRDVYPFLFAICLGEGSTRDLLAKGKDTALPIACCSQIVCPGHFHNSSFITRHNIPGGYLLAGQISSWPSLTQQLPSGPVLVCLSLCILRAPRWSGHCPYYCLCGSGSPWMKVTQSCSTLCDPMDYTVHGGL